MQGVLEQDLVDTSFDRAESSLGTKIGFVGKLFGCWHKRLGRPITRKNLSYRSCLECGARREFNTERFETSGPFYYPPMVKPDNVCQIT